MKTMNIAQNNSQAPAHAAPPGAATPSVPAPQADVQWNCKTFAMDDKGQAAGALPADLTVGSKFLVSCEGPNVSLKKDQLSLEVPKEQKYQLKILQPRELSETRGEFVATSWAPGLVKLANPVLTDGSVRVGLGPFQFNVASVIDKKNNPEAKAFAPWSPMHMALPTWLYLSVGILLAAGVAVIALSLRRVLRRKALLRLLEQHPITLSPYHQFNKELRLLVRTLPSRDSDWSVDAARNYFQELDDALKWFLARELILSAFNRRPYEILSELKRSHPTLYSETRRDFAIAFLELEKAQGSAAQPSARVAVQDAHQIAELARTLADKIKKDKED